MAMLFEERNSLCFPAIYTYIPSQKNEKQRGFFLFTLACSDARMHPDKLF